VSSRLEPRSPEFIGLVVLTVMAVVPLWVGRFLPLFDYPAHLIVPAAMLHASDPAARIAELYDHQPGLNPNSLHYAFTYVLAQVLPLEVASKLFLSLAVAALPWAMVFTLRTFGRDVRLAYLAVPLCYSRAFWYGFVGHCAALSLSLVVLSLVALQVRSPSRRTGAWLGLTMLVLPFAHFFTMVLTFGAAVVVAVRERSFKSLPHAAPVLAGPLVMVPWFLSALSNPSGRPSIDGQAFALWGGPKDLLAMLSHWFMDGYANHLDEVVAVTAIVVLALLFIRPSFGQPANALSSIPLTLGVLFSVGYFVLPFELHRPFEWWAMNVRLIPMAYLWLVVAAPVASLTVSGQRLLIPLVAVVFFYFGFVAVDFWRFNQREAGLSQVLEKVPKGASVLGLYTGYREPMHYMHFEHFYASAYAVIRGGGVAAPFTSIPQAWWNPKLVPPHPMGGDAASFSFAEHGAGFSHFLVRVDTVPGNVADPLVGRSEVALIDERLPWRLYGCVTPSCKMIR